MLKAGEEIKSLARFIGTQRTAFRKLLKKYKKWTGSTLLEDSVRREVLDDPKSFSKYDLGPLLDDYSATLHDIRALYETRAQQGSLKKQNGQHGTTTTQLQSRLQDSLASGSRTDFDTAFATSPLGSSGSFASYFIHPENVVELQVLLLQQLRYFANRLLSSTATPTPSSPRTEGGRPSQDQHTNHFSLIADNAERFLQEQTSLTVHEREHSAGSTLQMTNLCARWNSRDDALVAARTGSPTMSTYRLKPKHVDGFFDKSKPFLPRRESMQGSETELSTVRDVLTSDEDTKSLYSMSSNRSRFVSLSSTATSNVLATLDIDISFEATDENKAKSTFPFAVFQVRQEGANDTGLLGTLDGSHLLERVRGFSLEYHAIWQLYKPSNVAAPFWIPTLKRDIRKLPPAASKRMPGANSNGNQDSSATANNNSNSSSVISAGTTDETTAVDTSRNPSMGYGDSEGTAPPLRAFRNKKRRREFPQAQQTQQPKYWSEYDHPEDGSEAGDAYVIYIDPNERSSFEVFFDKLARMFSRKKDAEEDGLLSTPSTPRDDESSSDEESRFATRQPASYGAITTMPSQRQRSFSYTNKQQQPQRLQLPQFAAVSLVASLVILVVAYLLAATGRHKLATEVDAGVIFAIVSSLVFAVIGVAALWREREIGWLSWMIAGGTLIVDAVGSGGLLAWMLA